MTSQHPITPPAELVQEWTEDWNCDESIKEPDVVIYVAAQAAQWGADQELEACCEWLYQRFQRDPFFSEALRAVRRPRPTSLKEQALNQLRALNQEGVLDSNTYLIRKALEALSDD